MGYDTDRFTTTVNESLTCCICRDVLEDPVQSPCEHAYCKSCIEAWLVHEVTCPEDRQPLSASSLRPLFRYMRNDLNRLQIRCKNMAYGCEIITDLEFIESHERDCMMSRLKCPNERCSYYASQQEMAAHTRTCEYNQQECPRGCGLLLMNPCDADHSCIQELRTTIEVLRSEMTCKYEDHRREMELRLDMQRGHMIQKEATLQSQIDALKSENSKLVQNVKLLMDMELMRRQDIEKLELEKQELMELLRENLKSDFASGGKSFASDGESRGMLRRSATFKGKVTTL